MEANKILERMIGNTYDYEGSRYTVYDVRIKGNVATLETDKEPIELPVDGLEDYMHEFMFIKSNMLMKSPDAVEMITSAGYMYQQLQQTLMDSIQKVQEDPGYIGQAQAVNETVNTFIGLEKVKIQALQLLKG